MIVSYRVLLAAAAVTRAIMIIYGIYHDGRNRLKFTDIDYTVFTDAARFVLGGGSPYERETYRYTPALAFALIPNLTLHHAFGKILFCAADLIVAELIRRVLSHQKVDSAKADASVLFWLFNPLTIGISARGSSESIIVLFVIACLYCLLRERWILSGILYGTAIHLKIYPVIYALAIYLWMNCSRSGGKVRWISWLSLDTVKFGVSAALSLALLTILFYGMYGWEFLEHTYFYHIRRSDIRHNFSPYFYMLYLLDDITNPITEFIPKLLFIPQLVLIVSGSFSLFQQPALCWFALTSFFVAFNKVCTSQYFVWYLSLLPIILPNLNLTLRRQCAMFAVWLVAQGAWLAAAYRIEFDDHEGVIVDLYLPVWLTSLAFLAVNVYLTVEIVVNFEPKPASKKL